MATRHNRRFVLAHRRQQVAELYLQGLPQATIAEQLHIAQATVSADLDYIRKMWQASSVRDFGEVRAKEMDKLDLIEREAWAGWQRSQKPAQSAVISGAPPGTGQQTRKTMKNQNGDPRFLQQINHCISQRRGLLGLDVLPAALTPEEQFDANVSLEVRRQRILVLATAVSQGERIGPAGTGTDHGLPGNLCDGNQRRALENGAPSVAPGPDDPAGH